MKSNCAKNIDGEFVKSHDGSKVPTGFVKGKPIGTYMDTIIYDQITDNHGVIRFFEGITSDATRCKPGGIIARPGILYELRESLK